MKTLAISLAALGILAGASAPCQSSEPVRVVLVAEPTATPNATYEAYKVATATALTRSLMATRDVIATTTERKFIDARATATARVTPH